MPDTYSPEICQASAAANFVCQAAVDGVQCILEGGCTITAWVKSMLDPWGLWYDRVFKGRAKVGIDSATDDVALFLIPSPNPVIRFWGVGIRVFEAQRCTLSGSGASQCVTGLRNLATRVRADLTQQFGQAEGDLLFQQYAYLTTLKNPDSNTLAIRARGTLDRRYNDAVRQGKLDPRTGMPPRRRPPNCPPCFSVAILPDATYKCLPNVACVPPAFFNPASPTCCSSITGNGGGGHKCSCVG
jgi:hypothetical protein